MARKTLRVGGFKGGLLGFEKPNPVSFAFRAAGLARRKRRR